jgi:hypothetical protein
VTPSLEPPIRTRSLQDLRDHSFIFLLSITSGM